MADSVNAHTSVLNVTLAGANLTENFQNLILLIHTWIKAMGGIVQASSNGVVADLNDNVAVIADVVSASGVAAHTWIVYLMPSGWYLTLECNDGDATPREADHFGADTAGYDLTGLVTTAPPTAINPGNEWNRVNVDHIPTAVPATPMTVHRSVDSAGKGWFCCSIDGTTDGEFGIKHEIFPLPDNPTLPYAWYVDFNATGAFSVTRVTTSSNWRSHHINGVDLPSLAITSPATMMSTWTAGEADSTSEPVKTPMMVNSNTAGSNRAYGSAEDFRLGAINTPSNTVEDADPDLQRFVTIDNSWLMVESSQLPAGPSPLQL